MPSTNDPKRVILYARLATEVQAEDPAALERQFGPPRDYARTKGYEVIAEITDAGWTGSSIDRPGLNRAWGTAAQENVFAVLAARRDRFARRAGDLALLDEEFGKHGCRLLGVDEEEAKDA
ncbi:MAG: recombinase family protein [Rubrobacter sp.]|nr:recombinase family protein [Rubrobacter sp.]